MSNSAHERAEAAERAYRVVDGIYRVHRDLFAIEAVLQKTAHLQVRLAKQATNGRMAALVAGMLVVVPILVSLGDIKWGSAPAIGIYVVIVGVILLWLWQVRNAGKAEKEILAIERESLPSALESREDYTLEEINASVTRSRLIRSILECLDEAVLEVADPAKRTLLTERSQRFREILTDEVAYVESLATASAEAVRSGKKSRDDHNVLIDWCSGIPGFKSPPL